MNKRPTDEELTIELTARTELAPPTSTAWRATIIDGPGAGTTYDIEDIFSRRILLGTSPACDVRLTDRAISRRHAAIEAEGSVARIIDLGSRNGTSVGGVRIRDAELQPGATVRIGDTSIRFDTDGVQREVIAWKEARFEKLIGAAPEMRALYPYFARAAEADVSILVEGETGTGKEVLAESLHDASPRKDGPFVVFDCTAVAPALLEADLFGHERGAFTGADATRPGVFEQANGGTLFIDEIGELDIGLQAKLLRALERKEVRRVGSNAWRSVDLRVVCATRRDLEKEIQAKRFRDDLFFRIAHVRLELPPLRKRSGDIALLAHFFWRRMGGDPNALLPDVVQRFESYEWPGNVRELQYAVARQLALGDFAPPSQSELPLSMQKASGNDFLEHVARSGEDLPRARQRVVDEFERRYVSHMLEVHGGNVTRAAAASGIGRRYFQMVRAKR